MAILYRIAPGIGIHKRPCCLIFVSGYPVFSGRHVRFGIRQSMPSSSIASCAEVRLILPSFAAGQTNRPRSNRLLNRHAPCESHHMILSKSPRRPRKTNRWPEYGSSANTFSACAANVLNPRRMSVTPAASQTRVLLGTGIKPTIPEPNQQLHSAPLAPRPEHAAHPTA